MSRDHLARTLNQRGEELSGTLVVRDELTRPLLGERVSPGSNPSAVRRVVNRGALVVFVPFALLAVILLLPSAAHRRARRHGPR